MSVKDYHLKRIPFVIMPNSCIIVGYKNAEHSHSEMLKEIGMQEYTIKEIIENNPKGYFLDNSLVLYQGDKGDTWTLKESNFPEVRKFYPEIKRLLQINSQTKVFTGVERGKPGSVWKTINEVGINFFDEKE